MTNDPFPHVMASDLKDLSLACGVSGFEEEIRNVILTSFQGLYDEAKEDALGNCIMIKNGTPDKRTRFPGKSLSSGRQADGIRPRPIKVMLAAHMDEVGLVVTKIEEGGFLRFTCSGRIDPRVLPGAEVTVLGKNKFPGIIGSTPPHIRDAADEGKAVTYDDLYIDTGFDLSRLKEIVRIGDPVSFSSRPVKLLGARMAGKSLDNRAGVLTVKSCLERLVEQGHMADVVFVATAEEEVGLCGATTAAWGVDPDLAIAVDVTFGLQPGVARHQALRLEAGPAIGIGPNIHPGIERALESICQDLEIPYQEEIMPGQSGTDAWAIQIARNGIPTGLISIPVRSMHTPAEVVSLKDVMWGGILLSEFISRLDAGSLKEMMSMG